MHLVFSLTLSCQYSVPRELDLFSVLSWQNQDSRKIWSADFVLFFLLPPKAERDGLVEREILNNGRNLSPPFHKKGSSHRASGLAALSHGSDHIFSLLTQWCPSRDLQLCWREAPRGEGEHPASLGRTVMGHVGADCPDMTPGSSAFWCRPWVSHDPFVPSVLICKMETKIPPSRLRGEG